MANVNMPLKIELIKKFGSQIEAARQMGIREAKLSYIIRGHAQPSNEDLSKFRKALGRAIVDGIMFSKPTPKN